MQLLLAMLLVILLAPNASGQQKKSVLIQQVILKDSVLIKEIKTLIAEEEHSSTDPKNFFKRGLGYVDLHVFSDTHGDTIGHYYLAGSLHGLKKKSPDSIYPPFYSYLGNRLILIHIDGLENVIALNFSAKSKARLRKLQDRVLEKKVDATFHDMAGRKAFRDKNFRMDYFRFHAGRYVYIIRNKPPLVIRESNSVR